MSNFNPREPITDPSVFAPRGMYVDNRRGKRVPGEEEDDKKAFIFNSSDMKQLNRFLATGRNLQTTRAEYLRLLGIPDKMGEISPDLGKLVDHIVGTYSPLKKDCVEFKDVTWNRIVEIAGDIKTYATMSGGKVGNSYYVLMLRFIGDYHDENEQPNPDKAKLEQLKQSIQFVIDAELKKLGELQAGAAEALTGLGNFQKVCEAYGVAVEGNQKSVENQLRYEGNDIDTLKDKIKDVKDEIKELQRDIDAKNRIIDEAPWYMWVGLIGCIVGTAMIIKAKEDRARMLKAMEKAKKLLVEHENKQRTATRLVMSLESINDQVISLGEEITPTIHTLQKLQGAWKNMETDLKSIQDLMRSDTASIPPMQIAEPQLQGIVDQWNELKEYASRYIESAYISEDPEVVTMDEYINELRASIKTIEAMQEEEVKG